MKTVIRITKLRWKNILEKKYLHIKFKKLYGLIDRKKKKIEIDLEI